LIAAIRLEHSNHILIITLNRPDRLNAISGPMLNELALKLKEANEDPDVRVVIITGAGKALCSGLDLGMDETFETAVDHLLIHFVALTGMDDFKEALQAYTEKRPSRFMGR
jgi:enoyl-CoA hydratase/carnithine racemase